MIDINILMMATNTDIYLI